MGVDWSKYLIRGVDWSEHYLKKGDPDAPTYYIIRRAAGEGVGIFSNYFVFGCHIRYALSKGYIPVVDLQNYPNANLAHELIGKENAWEYYFEQPLRIGLKQAYNGENVLLGSGEPIKEFTIPPTWQFCKNKNNLQTEWQMLVKLGLLKIKPEFQQEIDDTWNKLFAPGDRVLGVKLRGTDILAKQEHGHHIPPPVEYALSHVAAKVRKWNCNKIFLATEDKNYVWPFKQVFGDACVMLDKEYIDYDPDKEQTASGTHSARENDYYLRGKEYVMDVALLAKCSSFVSAASGGMMAVLTLTDKFEHTYFFNLGAYGVVSFDDFMDDD